MAGVYYTGKDGAVAVGEGEDAVAYKIKSFKYEETDEVNKTRGGGDRGTSRDALAMDWSFEVSFLVRKTAAPFNISAFRGVTMAFTAISDGETNPKVKIVGAGLCTQRGIPLDVGKEFEINVKVECESADEADFPVITTHV